MVKSNKPIDEIILDSISPVIENLQHIKINWKYLEELLPLLASSNYSHWNDKFIFNDGGWKTLNYFFIFSALSFYYWKEPKWSRFYNGVRLGGSESLFYSLTDAIKNGKDITSSEYLSKLSFDEFSGIMKGETGKLSLLDYRYKFIKEIGSVLEEKYEGKIHNLYIEQDYDVNRIVKELAKQFKCMNDSCVLDNHKVFFWKKAQETISLSFEALNGNEIANFHSMENLALSSDYKIPQLLSSIGIIEYSNSLREKILNKGQLLDGTREVIEIRASTIFAVDKIKKELKTGLSSFQISNLLWSLSQTSKLKLIPSPRIVSTVI